MQREREKKENAQEVFHPLVHPPNDCSGQNWAGPKQQLLPGLICRCKGPSMWAILCYFLRAHWRGAGWRVEQPGYKLVPLWDAGATCGVLMTPCSHNFRFILGLLLLKLLPPSSCFPVPPLQAHQVKNPWNQEHTYLDFSSLCLGI